MVPNGIEINRYRYSDDERNSCREELGFKESDFVIGHTGSLNGVKNQELIQDIAGILKEKLCHAHLFSSHNDIFFYF